MKKRLNLKLLSVLCVVVIAFLALSTFALSAKPVRVEAWIGAGGGDITLRNVSIHFEPNVLTKDTKIFIIDFGNNEYQFGSEIHIEDDTFFTVCFTVPPTKVITFIKGEWVEVDGYDGSGCFETNHFSRYRGC